MRGKRQWGHKPHRHMRNIPAYAGKTPQPYSKPQAFSEHPRVCGENRVVRPPRLPRQGTSPRMRGKPLQLITPRLYQRNIPAYAGKTDADGPVPTQPEEHPRVCGENPPAPFCKPCKPGTSPRMRGKPAQPKATRANAGNIPAYAGKTPPWPTSRIKYAEHPRVCGENPALETYISAI